MLVVIVKYSISTRIHKLLVIYKQENSKQAGGVSLGRYSSRFTELPDIVVITRSSCYRVDGYRMSRSKYVHCSGQCVTHVYGRAPMMTRFRACSNNAGVTPSRQVPRNLPRNETGRSTVAGLYVGPVQSTARRGHDGQPLTSEANGST